MSDYERCESKQPKTGLRCGLPKGHGPHPHSILIPTDAPWFPKNPTTGQQERKKQA